MQEEGKEADADSPQMRNEDKSGYLNNIESKLDFYGRKLTLLWGKLFRFFVILVVGVVGYFWFEPAVVDLSDVPFAQLTLKMIFKNISSAFGVLIPLGCIVWFFNFPEGPKDEMNPDNPYYAWASGSLSLAVIAGLCWYFFRH